MAASGFNVGVSSIGSIGARRVKALLGEANVASMDAPAPANINVRNVRRSMRPSIQNHKRASGARARDEIITRVRNGDRQARAESLRFSDETFFPLMRWLTKAQAKQKS
ncbi:MAG: hypothetical protein HYZ60_09305 [Methylocystis sp.]|nr:hypothetical protein [Methylocystis sp.]